MHRLAESWFSILFALLPAPLIALGAVLIHFRIDIAYRLLQSETAVPVIRYVRMGLFTAALLWLSQLPLIGDIVSAYQCKQGGFKLLLYLQAAAAVGMFIFGIILWITVRDNAYSNAQWIEIKKKGIYDEFADLDDLVEHPRIEYALITDPRQWPLWYYCGSGSCFDKTPLLVNVDLCPDPKDCSEDFAGIIRRVRFRIQNSDTTPPYPPTLRLLSPAGDLAVSEAQWQRNIRFTATVLFWLQLCYFFLHAILAALNRLVKKP